MGKTYYNTIECLFQRSVALLTAQELQIKQLPFLK